MQNHFAWYSFLLPLFCNFAVQSYEENTDSMLQDEITHQILQVFRFAPTSDQRQALDTFARFLLDRDEQSVMILRGSAGTGKTALASAMVQTLRHLGQKVVLMAPTGRAAMVFSLHAGLPAWTIHRRIYRERTFAGPEGQFNLNANLASNTLFIVDEASMIANYGGGASTFGSGCLLDDLVRFVYGGRGCRLMLIGDCAQLPPVGEQESPALQDDVLERMGLRAHSCDLDEVLRQGEGSGILVNATTIRQLITRDTATLLPRIRVKGFADVAVVPGDELIETLSSSFSEVGTDETMVITRSNKRANIYNQGIRRTVLDCESELSTGDIITIVRNKYLSGEQQKLMPLLANGDRARILRVHNTRELYGFHFADITISMLDYNDVEIDTTAILDTLTSDAPALTREQDAALFQQVMEDYADVPRKADRMRQLREDDYYNALQIKFGYAVTCHKAQGGQWAHVYIDQGYITDEMLSADYLHWLYTAFTRATERLYLVNWPKKQLLEDED